MATSELRKIRDLIEAHRLELETYGNLPHVRANEGQRDRPAFSFFLNEEQALVICMFSGTAKAAAVRKQVIATFMAYRRGQLVVAPQIAIPTSFAEALRLAADEAEKRLWRKSQPLNNSDITHRSISQ